MPLGYTDIVPATLTLRAIVQSLVAMVEMLRKLNHCGKGAQLVVRDYLHQQWKDWQKKNLLITSLVISL